MRREIPKAYSGSGELMNISEQCAQRKEERKKIKNDLHLKKRREARRLLQMKKVSSAYVWNQCKETIYARINMLPVMDFAEKRAAIRIIIDQELSA
jgi:hypothetical protein